MSNANWEYIHSEIALNHTSWINTLSKENLIEVCTHYQILADDRCTVEHLRKSLNKYIKTIIGENNKTENKSNSPKKKHKREQHRKSNKTSENVVIRQRGNVQKRK